MYCSKHSTSKSTLHFNQHTLVAIAQKTRIFYVCICIRKECMLFFVRFIERQWIKRKIFFFFEENILIHCLSTIIPGSGTRYSKFSFHFQSLNSQWQKRRSKVNRTYTTSKKEPIINKMELFFIFQTFVSMISRHIFQILIITKVAKTNSRNQCNLWHSDNKKTYSRLKIE